jgi:chromosome segregation protein
MFTLDRMEIHGFKSFFTRTAFEFRPGIIAVVGPNGCGKSNIGDAISWVLGDQSPRSLRADRMSDVIFNGSESRKPLGMAEVTLKFMKTNGGPDPSEEFVVTRRLFRDGNSEYCLNGVRCRLKDIQEMLVRSQVGSRLYSVIEQGKVDLLLTSKPKDRRYLFEEAAGVLGYKAKRRVALGKLEATQMNLVRIHDILAEVTKQTSALRRQVAKARRHQRLHESLRSRRGVLLRSRLEELERETGRAGAARNLLSDQGAGLAADLAKVEAEVERLRRAGEEGEIEIRRVRDRLNDLSRALDRDRMQQERSREQREESLRAILRHSGEAAEMSARVAEREAEVARLAAQLEEAVRSSRELERELEIREEEQRRRLEAQEAAEREVESSRSDLLSTLDRQAEARSRRERIEGDRKRLGQRREELLRERQVAQQESEKKRIEQEEAEASVSHGSSELSRVRQDRDAASEALAAEQKRLEEIAVRLEGLAGTIAQMEERLRSLEEAERGAGGNAEALKSILTLASEGKLSAKGRAADAIEVEPRYLAAAEAALGDLLEAVLVQGSRDILEGVRHLREAARGRCGFYPSRGEPPAGPALPDELRGDPRCLGSLAEKATLKDSAVSSLQEALRSTLLAVDLPSALDLHARYPGWTFVTPEGDLVRPEGLVQGGGVVESRGILSRRHLQRVLERQLAEAKGERDGCEREREQRESVRLALTQRAGALEARLRDQDAELVEARLRLARLEEDARHAERARQVAAEEDRRLEEERESLERENTQLGETLAAAEATRKEKEEGIARSAEGLGAHRETVTQGAEALGAFRSEVASRRERIGHEEAVLATSSKAAAEDRERMERAREQAAASTAMVSSLEAALASLEESLRLAEQERVKLAGELERMEMDAGTQKGGLSLLEQQEKAARAALDDLRGKAAEAEVEVARLEVEHKHLESTTRDELSLSLDELRALPPPEGEASIAQLEAEIAQLKERVESLGAVNLAALEQYQEMEERHQFLAKQKKDLEESIESLHETIRRINRTSREKFLEAFEKIQESFNRSFATLFGGGKAELRLMEDEDVLECGIEITASPPGKRLQNISLLSGGEKAMTAVALLFALFRYRPSPFCVLDEVDAPLDEANVGRFTRMLRDLTPETQFILITHNRRSMEAADLLYGITMDEPGVSRVVSMRLEN